jgi:hypothetical protein
VALAQDALPPAANAGTLTCTLMPAENLPEKIPDGATALSCSFEAISGPGGDFDGIIKRIGTDQESDAKIVLVWSVLAPKPDVKLKDLEGQYIGSLEQSPPVEGVSPGLRGGANDAIELRPLNAAPDSTNPAAISVLELALKSTKA